MSDELHTPVEDLEVSVRLANIFQSLKLKTLGDVVKLSEADLVGVQFMTRAVIKELKEILAERGLSLSPHSSK